MKRFDVIVIGAGSGLDIASAYAKRGKEVAVIEPGPLGGTCLNRGCIPSKMLIHRADIVEEIEGSEEFGIESSIESIDFANIIEEVNTEVAGDAEGIEEAIRKSDNHTLYKKEARFVGNKVIDIGEEEMLTAEKIFIAAGTRPLVPPVEGLEDKDYWTSKEALNPDRKPEELVIIGGGYISAELAHFYSSMGTEVKIIERGEKMLKREDRDISKSFTEIADEKWELALNRSASKVEKNEDDWFRVIAENEDGEEEDFWGEKLLVAAGRVPNTDKLELEDTDIELDERGFVNTDKGLETSVEGVYAIGDIAGNFMFKHSANLEAEIAFKNSVGKEVKADYTAMPHAVFSSPRIAGFGKTEQELEESDEDYVSVSYDYSDTGMGMAMNEENGFVKVLASREGKILGCHIMGPEASTLIHEALVAVRAGSGNVRDIKDTIHIHPALNEVVQRAFNQI